MNAGSMQAEADMAQPEAVDPERVAIDALRDIKDRVDRIGKRTVDDVFKLGEAFEEAAGILRGRFSAWVSHECRIEPRTVLGYRRVHTVLGNRRKDLAGRRIAPSVLVRIAFAPPELRDRALALVERGRDLKLADLRALSAPREPGPGVALRSAISSAARAAVLEIEGFAALGGEGSETDRTADARPSELAAALAVLMPGSPLADALRAFAAAPGEETRDRLAAEIDSFGQAAPAEAQAEVAAEPTVRWTEMTVAQRHARPYPPSAFMHGLTSLEICAGAGGQSNGLMRAGFVHQALVEIDPQACLTLRAAFPGSNVIEADLNEVDLSDYAGVDLIAGGPPCVSFSKAGKRLGSRDSRDLMPRAVELVETLRPRAVLLENVTGILERGNDFHRMDLLGRLARAGYHCEWRTVRAMEFGVPQARERAILVGFREKEAMARFSWPAPAPVSMDDFYAMSSALYDLLRADGYEPTEEFMAKLDRLAPTITGGSPKKQGADLGQENTRKVWRTMGIDPGDVPFAAPKEGHEGPVKLNIAMVAALQGFPSGWPFKGSRTSRFKQIANALPPIVALHLGCAIADALTGVRHDYRKEVGRIAAWMRLRPWSDAVMRQDDIRIEPDGEDAAHPKKTRDIPFALLRRTSSMHEPEGADPANR